MISSSPTDVRPVFEAIAANAAQVCEAGNANVYRFDGTLIHLEASHGYTAEELAAVQGIFPIPPGLDDRVHDVPRDGYGVLADPGGNAAERVDIGREPA